MLKEIHEQPDSLRNAMRGRVNAERQPLDAGRPGRAERELPNASRMLLFGCGTAWHAALIGDYLFEELASLPTDVEYASELRYRNPIVEHGTVAIADQPVRRNGRYAGGAARGRTKGALALGVVNVVGSTIARETDAGVYLHGGPEIGVASTKAFTAQVAVLAMMATHLGRRRHLSEERHQASAARTGADSRQGRADAASSTSRFGNSPRDSATATTGCSSAAASIIRSRWKAL